MEMTEDGKQIYDFNEQLTKGQKFEDTANRVMTEVHNLSVAKALPKQQLAGIDVWIKNNRDEICSVEYKSDSCSQGNVFIETISVHCGGQLTKAGWIKTCKAAWLIKIIPPPIGEMIWWDVKDLRAISTLWRKQYPIKKTLNKGYYSEGFFVPLEIFRKGAAKIDKNIPEHFWPQA